MNNKILVIEDNKEMRENISDILKLSSYEVISASNGKEGVVLAQKSIPDLILCDILMPELDGHGVIHILSKDKKTADIPFVFITAKAEKSDFRTGMNLGADDYITKPFDGLDLLKVVESRLHKNNVIKTSFQEVVGNDEVIGFKERQLKEIKKLTDGWPKKIFKKKELIFVEDRLPSELYYINKGLVKTYKSTQDGKELITDLLNDGCFLGYLSIFENCPYTASALALEDSEITLIPKQEFLTALWNNKEIATIFMKMFSKRLLKDEKFMLELAYFSIRQRTASILLQLHEDFIHSDTGTLVSGVSRKDISDMVGTATESLNRTLADFKDEKIIEILPYGLKILDFQKLRKAMI